MQARSRVSSQPEPGSVAQPESMRLEQELQVPVVPEALERPQVAEARRARVSQRPR